MNRPLDRRAEVNAQRFKDWLARFAGYRNPVTQRLIELWLEQFSSDDQDLAARLLDSIVFVDHGNIHTCFRQLLAGLDGWHKTGGKRKGRWFFCTLFRKLRRERRLDDLLVSDGYVDEQENL